jgi:hypothetical protein
MHEVTKNQIIAKSEEVASTKVQVKNYSVEPDPENIENDEIQSNKTDSESHFLKEGTHIDIITQL